MALAKDKQVNMGRYITTWDVDEFASYRRFNNRRESWKPRITEEASDKIAVNTENVSEAGGQEQAEVEERGDPVML